MSQTKHWCFTINNYNDADLLRVATFAEASCDYLIYGKEIGISGTPHLQGYLQLKLRQRLPFLKNGLHPTAHFEIARGTPQQASDYCEKEADFTKFGELIVGQGKRSDIDKFKT